MTTAKERLIADSRTELAQDIAYHIQERSRSFQKDVVTIDEVVTSAELFSQGLSAKKIARALAEVGATKLGQHSVDGRRQVLWAIRRTEIWQAFSGPERAAEYQRARGLFAELDDLDIPVLRARPGDTLVTREDLQLVRILGFGGSQGEAELQQEEKVG